MPSPVLHTQKTHPRLVDVEVRLGDAEEGVRLGDAEEGDVIVLEDVPRAHVLLVFAAEVVQLVVLEKRGEPFQESFMILNVPGQ